MLQYRNTLRDLLKLDEDLTGVLPPDGISKDGFANNAQTMVLSPLQAEAYFDIAEKGLDLCMVDERSRPVIQNFRMDLGRKINPAPCPDKLILGDSSALLDNADFMVTQLAPEKPFAYQPFMMRSKFDFIEGYIGNDTIREWRSSTASTTPCLPACAGRRATRTARRSDRARRLAAAAGDSESRGLWCVNTYGPMANFKVALRELPDRGNFRVTVKAARYDDGLLLEPRTAAAATDETNRSVSSTISIKPTASTVTIAEGGMYQIDVLRMPGDDKGVLSLRFDERHFAGALPEYKKSASDDPAAELAHGFIVVRLSAGAHQVAARYGDNRRSGACSCSSNRREQRSGASLCGLRTSCPVAGHSSRACAVIAAAR